MEHRLSGNNGTYWAMDLLDSLVSLITQAHAHVLPEKKLARGCAMGKSQG